MSSASPTTQAVAGVPVPKRARDAVKRKERRPPQPLFDAFWREGELALLFSEPGDGKSVLAVQIADALARGEPITHRTGAADRHLQRKKPQKVLYIDLVLSEKQFGERYFGYKFAPGLYRDVPANGQDLFSMVKEMVAAYGFKAVIIDDLSLVSRTADGTREALALMHGLRQLTLESSVSVLVLADTYAFVYGKQAPERGLRRSRVLCGLADSVFALYDGCIVQTRSRSGEKIWTLANKLRYTIAELDSGLLGMEFEPPKMDLRTRREIVDVKEMRDEEEMTFREIAAELKISKSQAHRLYRLWTPEIQAELDEQDREWDEEDAYDKELEEWTNSGGKITWSKEEDRWVKALKKPEEAEPKA